MTDASGSTTWSYDSRGRITSLAQTILGSDYMTSHAYDSLDRVTAMIYPDSEAVTTTYGAHGLPVSLTGTSVYVSAQTYDPQFRPLLRTYGNGVTASFNYYDATGELDHDGTTQPRDYRLASIAYANGLSLLQEHEYDYDRAGNITKMWQTDETGIVHAWTNGYDDLDRLTSATATNPSTSLNWSYDAIGRITTGPLGSYTYADPTHVHAVTSAGPNSYDYDANGAVATRSESDSTYAHVYDIEDRPASVSSSAVVTTFVYDGQGTVVAKQVNGVDVARYAGGGAYEDRPSDGSSIKYYQLGSALGAFRDSQGAHYLGNDQLESITLVTDGNGGFEAANLRSPYGAPWQSSGTRSTDRSYVGGRSQEQGLGSLITLGQRNYSPLLGAFLSPDSLGRTVDTAKFGRPDLAPEVAKTVAAAYSRLANTRRSSPRAGGSASGDDVHAQVASALRLGAVLVYTYGQGNPAKFSDPSGLDCFDALVGGSGACDGGGGGGGTSTTGVGGGSPRGGAQPVLKGAAGRTIAEETLEAQGYEILNKEVTFLTADGRMRVDLLVRDAEGNLWAVEVKTGPNARVSSWQMTKYQDLEAGGGIPVGQNAIDAGLQVGVPMGSMDIMLIWLVP